jgi:hypothetical protein
MAHAPTGRNVRAAPCAARFTPAHQESPLVIDHVPPSARSSASTGAPRIAAFVSLLLVLLLGTAGTAAAAPTPITAGAGLDWGLKASWRTYIGTAGTTLSDGATYDAASGRFHFPVTGGSYDPETRETTVQFGGTVQFLGHCEGEGGTHVRPCALDTTLSAPRIELTGDGGFLYGKMVSRPIDGGELEDLPDVQIAALDLEDATPVVQSGKVTWDGLEARMAAEGSKVFTYAIGTLLDAVSLGYDGDGGTPALEEWATPSEGRYTETKLPIGGTGRFVATRGSAASAAGCSRSAPTRTASGSSTRAR